MSNAEVAPEATDTDQTGKTLSRKSQTMRQFLFPDMLLQLVGPSLSCCRVRTNSEGLKPREMKLWVQRRPDVPCSEMICPQGNGGALNGTK